ncbi:MAG: outer membrane protein assembly factor BamD [bacterium]|nr:outer membrane protein assembly factor BamD [bacterium]
MNPFAAVVPPGVEGRGPRVRRSFRRRWIPAAAVALAVAAGAGDAGAFRPLSRTPSFRTADEAFEFARTLEREERHRKAADAYQKVVDDFPSSPLAAEAQFRVAEMLEKAGYFYPAFGAYQAVLDRHPSFPKVNLILQRQFRIGNLFLQGRSVGFLRINPAGSTKRAITIFTKILSNAPFSELAPNAQYNLGLAYLEARRYTEAVIEFEKIPFRYPHSEFVPQAKYQLGVCAYRQAVAAPYDQEAAQEAMNRLSEFIRDYPGDRNVEPAKEMLAEIEGRKAEALYQIGRFYEERGNPRASLIYLREVIRDYPLTRYGEKARKIAAREERKLEAVEAVRAAREAYDEADRLIRGQRAAIAAVTGKGRRPWQIWKYLVAPTLTPDETTEVEERRERIAALEERLALARLDLAERRELMQNRVRLLRAEAAIEKVEDELRAAQVDLHVAQGRLAGVGDLPEGGAAVLETAAREIARKEELVRSREAQLERLRAEMEGIAARGEEGERRIRERYGTRREALRPRKEEPPPPAEAEAEEEWEVPAPPLPRRFPWPFGRKAAPDGSEVLEKCEGLYREAERLIDLADGARAEGNWLEARRSYDAAALRLMEVRGAWPAYRSGDVERRLRQCREGLERAHREGVAQQFAELSSDLEARIRANPADADALFSLGDLRRYRGETDGAVEAYRAGLEARPGDPRGLSSLGSIYMEQRRMRAAAACYGKAVEAAPGDARARHNLGVALREMGDYEGARREMERALEADPDHALSYLSLGQLYHSAFRDREGAAAYWARYIELRPDDPRCAAIREWLARERARAGAERGGARGGILRRLMGYLAPRRGDAPPNERSSLGNNPLPSGP